MKSVETDNKPDPLEVAQQIIDQFEPGRTVASWKVAEDAPNTVELEFTDTTSRRLWGLFTWHIRHAAAEMKAREEICGN